MASASTFHSDSDASSSFSEDFSIFLDHNRIDDQPQDREYSSYDEFCMVLRGRAENGSEGDTVGQFAHNKPKKFSYVSNWRRRLPADLTIVVPPSPLFDSFDGLSSPVASIDPSRLNVTSVSPSEHKNYSPSTIASEQSPFYEIGPHAVTDHDVFYNADLDELSEVESTSSVSVPHPQLSIPTRASSSTCSGTPKTRKHARFQNVSSAIRWLPTRIKYSILSHRASRKWCSFSSPSEHYTLYFIWTRVSTLSFTPIAWLFNHHFPSCWFLSTRRQLYVSPIYHLSYSSL
jgi:hypothetical protein